MIGLQNRNIKDVLDYIISVNCHYQFNTIPLRWFGLLDGETNE